jgi:hypothetical protein
MAPFGEWRSPESRRAKGGAGAGLLCRRGIFCEPSRQTHQALTQVPGTGQTSSQRGMSEWPSHSVHFLGLITKVSPFMEIAAFGHSNSQRLQPVQLEAMIL